MDLSIKNNETIILLFPEKICFSDVLKGNMILVKFIITNQLESKNLVATKSGGDEHQFVLTDKGFSTGKHYFEIIVRS